MNSIILMRKSNIKGMLNNTARYGKPINRWKWVIILILKIRIMPMKMVCLKEILHGSN
jgi:hypothetical protein